MILNTKKRSLFLIFATTFVSNIYAQNNHFIPFKKYNSDSLKIWTSDLFQTIKKNHPGFYRYTSKDRFDFLIDSTNQTINKDLNELEYYRKLKPLIAQIGCLHTNISLSDKLQKHLDNSSTMLPLELFIDAKKNVFITKSYDSENNIPIGSQIISINKTPIKNILSVLLKSIPSDGYNETEKILLLNHRFTFWYQTIVELNTAFSVEIIHNNKQSVHHIQAVNKSVFPKISDIVGKNQKTLEFDIVNNIAVLKIHSFAKTSIKEANQNFKKFIKQVFKEIKVKGIKELIIDLRYNTGGTDSNAALLASYFFDKPFRYWDKIEVTKAIANDVKGLDRLFYKKPTKHTDELYLWKKTWFNKEFDYYEIQQPSFNNYKGNTYLITNGLCMSSCADFSAILSHNNKAIVVGQETGGGYQGNTSGMMPNFVIPTGLRVTIPLHKYTNAVDSSKNFGRGTIPDIEIAPNFNDWIDKRDIEMERIIQLINNKKEI